MTTSILRTPTENTGVPVATPTTAILAGTEPMCEGVVCWVQAAGRHFVWLPDDPGPADATHIASVRGGFWVALPPPGSTGQTPYIADTAPQTNVTNIKRDPLVCVSPQTIDDTAQGITAHGSATAATLPVSGSFATVGGGDQNTVRADNGTVNGGLGNVIGATAADSVIGGGASNTCVGNGVIGGGDSNIINTGVLSGTIGGGLSNEVSGTRATVGGGVHNGADGATSTVAGGDTNTAVGVASTVAGGVNNTANGVNSTIGGGSANTANSTNDTVAGGASNTAAGGGSVGGGLSNTITGVTLCAIGGGELNTIVSEGGTHHVIGGGHANHLTGGGANTIGGGDTNSIGSISFATIGGGTNNTIDHDNATIAGGSNNTASGTAATVGGGDSNTASGGQSTIAGGDANAASGDQSAVGGGVGNTASGQGATVVGGNNNRAGGQFATAAGDGASATLFGEFVIGGSGSAQGKSQFAIVQMQGFTPGGGANESVVLALGDTNPLILPSAMAYKGRIEWSAVRTDVGSASYGSIVFGCRIAGGVLTIDGQSTPGDEQIAQASSVLNTMTLSAPGPGGELRLTFATGAGVTAAMKVKATILLTQISPTN